MLAKLRSAMKRFELNSIFNKLLLIFLAITILITVAVGMFSYQQFKDSLIDLSKKQLSIVSRQAGSSIYKLIQNNVDNENVGEMNNNIIVFKNLTAIEDQLTNSYRGIFKPLNFTGDMYLTSQEGEVLAHTNEKLVNEDFSKKGYFQEILQDEEGKTIVHEDEESGNSLAHVTLTGYKTYTKENGAEYIIAYSKVASLDWVMAVEAKRTDVIAAAQKVGRVIGLFGLAAVIIVVVIAVIVARNIANPIKKVSVGMEKMAEGDFTLQLDLDRGDELGTLGASFNKMIQRQSEMVDTVRNIIQDLNNSGDILSDTLDKFTDDVNYTLEEVNRISASTEEVSASSDQVTDMAEKTKEIVGDGSQAIQSVIKQMGQIRSTVNKAVEVIDNLEDKSAKIGEIVDLITNIAEQTNLLALNAAIEAARAGEAGQGFAVVADEIRDLASQSADAAEEIRDLIGETQDETKKAVKAIKRGTEEVKQGEEVIDKAGKAFEGIKEATNETAAHMEETSSATHELAEGAEQVVNVVDDLEEISQSIADISEEVDSKAENLEQLISQFKV